MKNTIKLALAGVLMAAGLMQTYGQATNTNVLYNVTITLTGFGQGPGDTVEPVKLTTQDLVTELGTLTGNTFGRGAKLIAVSTPGASGGPTFIVRETTGGTNNDVDVSAFLHFDTLHSVGKRGGTGAHQTGTDYEIVRVVLDNPTGVNFDVQGYATSSRSTIAVRGTVIQDLGLRSLSGSVAGTGTLKTRAGTPLDSVVKGTVSAKTPKVEEVGP